MQMSFDTCMIKRWWWMKAREIPALLRQSVTSLVYKLSSDMSFFSLIYACILRIISFKLVNFWYTNYGRREGCLLITLIWIGFQVKFPYFVCELTEYSLQLEARENSVNYTITVAACSTKAVKFTLSIVVYTGGLAKSQFALVARQKKRIGKRTNYFLIMCPKPFT